MSLPRLTPGDDDGSQHPDRGGRATMARMLTSLEPAIRFLLELAVPGAAIAAILASSGAVREQGEAMSR